MTIHKTDEDSLRGQVLERRARNENNRHARGTRAVSEGSAQSGGKAVEVARLGRKRFENGGAVDGAKVEVSVRSRSLILSMQSIDNCSYKG